jgi:Ca-activated chloride channel family protein
MRRTVAKFLLATLTLGASLHCHGSGTPTVVASQGDPDRLGNIPAAAEPATAGQAAPRELGVAEKKDPGALAEDSLAGAPVAAPAAPPGVDMPPPAETREPEAETRPEPAKDKRHQAMAGSRNAGIAGGAGTVALGAGAMGKAASVGHGYGVGSGRMSVDRDRSSGTEGYTDYGSNEWVATGSDALSTFAVDVDTASYTIARRKLNEGVLPPKAAVRVEEFVNYFTYGYAVSPTAPFSVTVDAAPSPFNRGRHIMRVGVATRAKSVAERKPANLVFLVDVSGSMQSPDKIDLARRSLRILVDNLKDGDTVSLVTYAGNTRVVLPPTGLEHKHTILGAIDDLTAGGSTAMASGIELAYRQAAKNLGSGRISRVIVLSDGDANVGPTSHEEILHTIAGHVKEGVTLSTIGFGMGNYKDSTMEQLANKGNGNNYYIDGISQARRVFQQQLGSTLEVVAKDVKLQVDFDKDKVSRYRLIGYENRDIADRDFRNDKVDAGEIGAGHQVTAVYEVELADGATHSSGAIATVRVRHKEPGGERASESAFAMTAAQLAPSFEAAPGDLRFAFAAAAFADVLRQSEAGESWDLRTIRAIASTEARDSDRKELVALIDKALALRGKDLAAIAR